MNMVAIIGNAITDPDLRYTEAGGAVCTLRVAVARLDDTKNPDVFTVVCWGRQAEIVAEYVTKGRRVGIDGRLHHSAGEPVEIIASRVQLLGEGAPRGPFADGVPGQGGTGPRDTVRDGGDR